MFANVFGMGIFADGGVFATKPYIAGGNYIKKMGDYTQTKKSKKSEITPIDKRTNSQELFENSDILESKDWEEIWTNMFWNFLIKHKDFFAKNPRMAMLIKSKLKKD
jgi:deoxyribodipyrimidine photolyase-related protein